MQIRSRSPRCLRFHAVRRFLHRARPGTPRDTGAMSTRRVGARGPRTRRGGRLRVLRGAIPSARVVGHATRASAAFAESNGRHCVFPAVATRIRLPGVRRPRQDVHQPAPRRCGTARVPIASRRDEGMPSARARRDRRARPAARARALAEGPPRLADARRGASGPGPSRGVVGKQRRTVARRASNASARCCSGTEKRWSSSRRASRCTSRGTAASASATSSTAVSAARRRPRPNTRRPSSFVLATSERAQAARRACPWTRARDAAAPRRQTRGAARSATGSPIVGAATSAASTTPRQMTRPNAGHRIKKRRRGARLGRRS